MNTLLTLAAIILLPAIPAFVLFKALPSEADVEGPWKGLKIKLGGAFAGYFAVVVVILSTHNVWDPPTPFQTWQVSGNITDSQGNPIEGPFTSDDILLTPPSIQPTGGGYFNVTFSTVPGPTGAASFPKLYISYPGYETVPVDLDPADAKANSQVQGNQVQVNQAQVNQDQHTITVPPIHMQALPPYDPTSANTVQPQPASGGTQ
jgi:hypothetical protein